MNTITHAFAGAKMCNFQIIILTSQCAPEFTVLKLDGPSLLFLYTSTQ